MITFSSDAYENIMYFSEVAQALLTLMGHSGVVPGALKAEEVPQALAYLQQGLAGTRNQNNQALQQNFDNAKNKNQDEEDEPKIGLAKRAIPLINMLQAAIKKECGVLWS